MAGRPARPSGDCRNPQMATSLPVDSCCPHTSDRRGRARAAGRHHRPKELDERRRPAARAVALGDLRVQQFAPAMHPTCPLPLFHLLRLFLEAQISSCAISQPLWGENTTNTSGASLAHASDCGLRSRNEASDNAPAILYCRVGLGEAGRKCREREREAKGLKWPCWDRHILKSSKDRTGRRQASAKGFLLCHEKFCARIVFLSPGTNSWHSSIRWASCALCSIYGR